MIPVLNLLQGITDKLNKSTNLEGQFIPNETSILALNRAQTKLVLKKVGLSNNYQLGLDSFKKRYEDLQILIEPYEKLTLTSVGDLLNSYKVEEPENLLLPIDLYVLATKGNCKDRILDVIEIVKHGDLQSKLKSPHYQPNFEYQETLATISGNNIFIYSDPKNSFILTSLSISYLRNPKYIDIAGYIHLDGTPSITTDCELESYLEDELLNLAVEELAMNTGNQELVQYSIQKSKEDE